MLNGLHQKSYKIWSAQKENKVKSDISKVGSLKPLELNFNNKQLEYLKYFLP